MTTSGAFRASVEQLVVERMKEYRRLEVKSELNTDTRHERGQVRLDQAKER
jgi:hypothetical protein